MKVRVGFGYDVHALAPGEKLILGGVHIPNALGTVGHSDGDVLLHALADAILGAVNSRDIGSHFPDTDFANKGMDSSVIFRHALDVASETGFELGNADCTIAAQKPKLARHIPQMQTHIATTAGCSIDDIAVKATTTEKLGFVGHEEGIAVYAVVLMEKKTQ